MDKEIACAKYRWTICPGHLAADLPGTWFAPAGTSGSNGYRARRHPEVRGQKPVNQIQSKPNCFCFAQTSEQGDQSKGAFPASAFRQATSAYQPAENPVCILLRSFDSNGSMVPIQDMLPALRCCSLCT